MSRSSSHGLPLILAIVGVACTQQRTISRVDPSSFNVQIVCADGDSSPACPAVPAGATDCPNITVPFTATTLGTPSAPVNHLQRHYIVQMYAVGNDGKPYTGYNTGSTCSPGPGVACAGIYVMYEGSVTPPRAVQTDVPPATGQALPLQLDPPGTGPNYVKFTNGRACVGVTIPGAFNQTALWVEDLNLSYYTDSSHKKRAISGTHALGASQAIWRPAPVIADIQMTTDPVYTLSPLTNKHVDIAAGTNGAPLVVTSVAAQYFTVTDTGQTGEDHAWGSLDVYSYRFPRGVYVGSQVANLSGSVSPFNGLSELSFPIWTVVNANPDPSVPVPAPHEIKGSDISQTLTRMKPWESALVQLKSPATGLGWSICPITGPNLTSYLKYNEWAVQPPPPAGCDPSDTSQQCVVDCQNWTQSMQVITKATVPGFDPTDPQWHQDSSGGGRGKKFCSITGVMTHVVPVAGVQLWEVNVRSAADLGQPVDSASPCP